ncbi:ExbD/TolR family protein [Sulfurivermis fontis]|uniref:ExbD/TolR family protein n=1 Tax=Sulfurivermis fontis TaxID=1972068 RepID=UPI000FDCDB33|nr:biopolymer transporter ExbD [Sulfurivermis fontis]
MAFGGLGGGREQPMAEMNVIPLVDIMLVLLVIFIITAPVLTHAVKVDLPQASSAPNETTPDTITLAIDAAGRLYWNDAPMEYDALQDRLAKLVRIDPETEVHLRAEKTTPYDNVARVLAAGRNAGIVRLGFVMEPERRN